MSIVIDQRAIVLLQESLDKNEGAQNNEEVSASIAEPKILLVKSADTQEGDEDSWDLPGGLLKADSGIGNWREQLEEIIVSDLGLNIVVNNPVYATDQINPETGEYLYLSFVQADAYNEDYEIKQDQNYKDAGWFSLEELGSLPFSTFSAKDAILEYLRLVS